MPHLTFIHGIANKAAEAELLELWRRALREADGLDLGTRGITSSMVYWADVLYEKPLSEEGDHESVGSEATLESFEDMDWASAVEGDEKRFVDRLTSRLGFEAAPPQGNDGFEAEAPGDAEAFESFERIPLPWFVKRRLMKVLLRDVHHYLFNTTHSPRPGESFAVQDEIRQRFLGALERDRAGNASGRHVVVSHSMGTVIAYDCLKRVADCPPVDALMTIGSPLGLDEIQDQLRPEWSREDGFPAKASGGWVNIYDRLDPVAGFDPNIANDYRRGSAEVVVDLNEQNHGRWRHSIDKYLGGEELRRSLAGLLGLGA